MYDFVRFIFKLTLGAFINESIVFNQSTMTTVRRGAKCHGAVLWLHAQESFREKKQSIHVETESKIIDLSLVWEQPQKRSKSVPDIFKGDKMKAVEHSNRSPFYFEVTSMNDFKAQKTFILDEKDIFFTVE